MNRLTSIIERVGLWPSAESLTAPANSRATISGKSNVFIIHGRDDAIKHEVARFVTSLGLAPLILHEQPNRGMTVIEKLESTSERSGFAIALLSPDDVGALATEADAPKPRARQNVIYELGYFVGLLGRNRVCAVLVGDVEWPSDVNGVVHVRMDNDWKLKVAKELRDAGFEVDMNRAL